ncbi:MAG: hypothetical protein AAGC81_05640 [Pseudomonadota bacterium]
MRQFVLMTAITLMLAACGPNPYDGTVGKTDFGAGRTASDISK